MIEPCPCNCCTERFIACSDRCPKDARGEFGHKAWIDQHHAEQKHLESNKVRWYGPWSDSREKRARSYIKSGGGRFKQGGYQ